MEIQTYRVRRSTRILFWSGFVITAFFVSNSVMFHPRTVNTVLMAFIMMSLYLWQSLITIHITENGIEIRKMIPRFKQSISWQEVKDIKNHVFFDYFELVSYKSLSVRIPKSFENTRELVEEIVKQSPNATVDKATMDYLTGISRK